MRRILFLRMSALALFCAPFCIGHAEIIEVPGDYSSISLALEATTANETVWVRPGTYQDRLIFPVHDVVVISDYFLLGDTAAIANTIIDASGFADQDTSSVLTITGGNTRATFVGGFTLTGGHGLVLSEWGPSYARCGGAVYMRNSRPTIHSCWIRENAANYSPAFWGDASAARISHCRIFDNCGAAPPNPADSPGGLDEYFGLSSTDTLIYEWNDISETPPCDPQDFSAIPQGIETNGYPAGFTLIVQFNHFHDYECGGLGGVNASAVKLFLQGNVFERIHVLQEEGFVINNSIAPGPATLIDNVFRNITLESGRCIRIGNEDTDRVLFERNWFESDSNSGSGPSVLQMWNPRGDFRDNMFLNCSGSGGTVQLLQGSPQGCDMVFERNRFFSNRAYGQDYYGSALSMWGGGHPCTFVNNWFEGNEGNTAYVDLYNYPEVDMPNNYWGDPSGPYHEIENPGGSGDSVPVNVHVTPWLTSPPELGADWEERLTLAPGEWTLEHAYPNPFNSTTRFTLSSHKPQPFEIDVYNTLGQKVGRIWQGVVPQDTPIHVTWDGRNDFGSVVGSGIYFIAAIPKGPGAGAPKSLKVIMLR